MIMLKVIYVARINKSAEVLAAIAKRPVTSQSELTSNRDLVNLFSAAKAKPARRVIDTIALLIKQGFVSVGVIDYEPIYRLTERGQAHLMNYQSSRLTITKSPSWDGKWYFVSFEIPESRKATRNNLILQLKRQGFMNYTKGLWIIPYNPSNFINGLRRRLQLDQALKVIVATSLDDQKQWLKKFNLNF